MRKIWLLAVVLTVLLLTVACQTAKPPGGVAPERVALTVAEVQKLADAYAVAWEAGDAAGLAARYTDDCIIMPSERPTVTGRAAAQDYFVKDFERPATRKGSIKVEETGGLGDLAFARGTFAFSVTPKGAAKPVSLTGSWINISKQQADGSWKISRSISNLDHPNPFPPR